MSKYRILEKKGHTDKKIKYDVIISPHRVEKVGKEVEVYIPRFIVQKRFINYEIEAIAIIYKDLKEFTSLEEAREFKRDLDLEEGIVRE